jgi:hypothetical protein
MGVREMRRGKLRDCYAVALARGGKRWLVREHRDDCDDGIDAFQKSRELTNSAAGSSAAS